MNPTPDMSRVTPAHPTPAANGILPAEDVLGHDSILSPHACPELLLLHEGVGKLVVAHEDVVTLDGNGLGLGLRLVLGSR